MKKLLAGLLSLTLTATVVAKPLGESLSSKIVNTSISASAEDDLKAFGYSNADLFVADSIRGKTEINPMDNSSSVVTNNYMYKLVAEQVIDNEWLIGCSVFWKNLGLALGGNFVDMATWKEELYETVIMDWLQYNFQTDEFEDEFNKSSAKYGWKIIQYISKSESIYDENSLGKMSVENAQKLLDDKFYKQNDILGKAGTFTSAISRAANVAKTGKDYFQKVSSVFAAQEAAQSRIEFLKQVKEVSNDADLNTAIDNIIKKMNASAGQIVVSEFGRTMLTSLTEKTFDLLKSSFKIPVLKEVKLGKEGFDWLCGTNELGDANLKLTYLYIINSNFTNAYIKIRDEYVNNKTEYNAEKFNNAYLDYIVYQSYASSITKDEVAKTIYSGAINQLRNLFDKERIESYNDFENSINTDINMLKTRYNMVGRWYNIFLSTIDKNKQMDWYYDKSVPVTGISFEKTEYEFGTNDIFCAFDYPIIKPSGATNTDVDYIISDDSVVSIQNNSHFLNIKKVGDATITAVTHDGGYKASITIHVVKGHGKDGISVSSSDNDKELNVGDKFTVGKLTYQVTKKGEVKVYDCDSSAVSISIPKYIAYKGYNYMVTSIGDWAFDYCESLTSVTIPNSVTSIGDFVFWDCGITSITIPNSVTSIGNNAFGDCDSLTRITIPESVTSIEYDAFSGCSSLTSITIPNSVTSIGDHAFQECTSLTSVNIPNSVTSIGNSAFKNCSSLTSITIPNSVTSIGYSAFYYCKSLTSITIPNSVTNIEDYAFYICSSLTSVTIGNSVTSIGGWAFYGCESLTNVTIPNSVTSIGDNAFFYCISLKSITIPDSVTSIGDNAFSYCISLKSITIPDSVTSIGNSAFYYCTSLTSINIPNSVTSIEYRAFEYCKSLKDVYYTGTKEEWNKISIDSDNYWLKNATIHYNYKPVHTHKFSSWTTTKKATCTTDGEQQRKCSVCGKTETKTIAKTNHSYKKVTVASTYFVKGYTGNKCTKCGTISNKKYTSLKTMSAPKASSNSTSSVKLTWSKVKDAKGYDVYQLKGKKWAKIKTTSGTSYTVSKLKAGTTYQFCVKPYTKSGSKTVYGNTSKTLITSTNPATVSFKLTAGSRRATVKWNKVTGASGYKVYYKTSKNGSWKTLKTCNNKTTSYTKTGLTKGKTYYFTVKAYRTVGGKTYSGAFTTKSVKVK